LQWIGGALEESLLTSRLLAISNHADMLGGGEHSFIDLLCHLPDTWQAVAIVPDEGELTQRLRRSGLETHILPLPPIQFRNFFKMLASIEAHRRLFKRLRPNIIYANGSRAALYGSIVGRILGIPIVWHCRVANTDPYLDPLLVKLNNKIVANSKATAARFSTHFKKRTQVVYNGVNIQWLRKENLQEPGLINDEWKVILTVARVSKWKRHDLVLAAFEELAGDNPKTHLVFLGAKDKREPDWWEFLSSKTKQSRFSERIHWVGQVEDVRPWLRAALMMVLASENEPFGRVLVEAMACGVPVIAARSGGVPEIVNHGQEGLLVTPGKVEELTGSMVRLLTDEVLREHLSKSARQKAERFSLESHIAGMVQVLEETLDKKPPSFE
jgi:glycosyltransferase involved in cell wall biosynthesis